MRKYFSWAMVEAQPRRATLLMISPLERILLKSLFDVGIGPLLQAIRITRARESSITLAGGVIATYEWEKLIADDLCHFVIEGEGETKLNYLLGALVGEGDLVAQPDIHFRSKSKNYTTTGNLEEVKIEGDLIDTYKLIG